MLLPTADNEQPAGPFTSQLQASRERLRFKDFGLAPDGVGKCIARVALEWQGQEQAAGEARGESTPHGELRAAAEATLRAIERFADGKLAFEFAGVKAMRGFDADIIMVSVMLQRGGAPQRLLGCHLAEQDLPRGAAMATLHATNRIVASYLATRSA